MKKMIFALMIGFLMVAPAMADVPQTWQTANQFTIGWDAVTTTSQQGEIKYAIYLQRVDSAGAVIPGEDPVLQGETQATTFTITFQQQGRFVIGAMTLLVDGADELAASPLVWSNDPGAVANGITFGGRYFEVDPIRGLRIMQ